MLVYFYPDVRMISFVDAVAFVNFTYTCDILLQPNSIALWLWRCIYRTTPPIRWHVMCHVCTLMYVACSILIQKRKKFWLYCMYWSESTFFRHFDDRCAYQTWIRVKNIHEPRTTLRFSMSSVIWINTNRLLFQWRRMRYKLVHFSRRRTHFIRLKSTWTWTMVCTWKHLYFSLYGLLCIFR